LYLLLYGLCLNLIGLENMMRNEKDYYYLGYLWERKKLLNIKSFFYICYDSFLNVVYGTCLFLYQCWIYVCKNGF